MVAMKAKREHAGYRIEAQLKRRIEAVAVKEKCSARSIVERMLERHLPDMEAAAGIPNPMASLLEAEEKYRQSGRGGGRSRGGTSGTSPE